MYWPWQTPMLLHLKAGQHSTPFFSQSMVFSEQIVLSPSPSAPPPPPQLVATRMRTLRVHAFLLSKTYSGYVSLLPLLYNLLVHYYITLCCFWTLITFHIVYWMYAYNVHVSSIFITYATNYAEFVFRPLFFVVWEKTEGRNGYVTSIGPVLESCTIGYVGAL